MKEWGVEDVHQQETSYEFELCLVRRCGCPFLNRFSTLLKKILKDLEDSEVLSPNAIKWP